MIEKFTPEEIEIIKAELQIGKKPGYSRQSVSNEIKDKLTDIFKEKSYEETYTYPSYYITPAIMTIVDYTLNCLEFRKIIAGKESWMRSKRLFNKKQYMEVVDDLVDVIRKHHKEWIRDAVQR